jgi:hypothetical protein
LLSLFGITQLFDIHSSIWYNGMMLLSLSRPSARFHTSKICILFLLPPLFLAENIGREMEERRHMILTQLLTGEARERCILYVSLFFFLIFFSFFLSLTRAKCRVFAS